MKAHKLFFICALFFAQNLYAADMTIVFDPAMTNYFFYHLYAFLFFAFGFCSALLLAFI